MNVNSNETDSNDNLSISSPVMAGKTKIDIDPKSWPRRKKYLILFIVALAGMMAPMSSTIIYPAIAELENDLNTSETLANGMIGVFIFFMGIAPLAWASYSDAFETRRNVYLASFILYIVGSVMCAMSKNIWLLLTMRAIQACGASSVQSIGAGSISDIFHVFGPLIGPVIGPVFGGYLADSFGWRWIFWFLTILGGVIIVLIFFLLPETFARQPQSQNLPTPTTSTLPRRRKFNPLLPLTLLKYPNITLSKQYNLSTSYIGLAFLAPGAGYLIGSLIGGRWTDFVLAKAKRKNNDISYPEMRIHSVWFSTFFLTISYTAYGWFVQANLHIAFPLISLFIGGITVLIIFSSTATYLVDAFPGKSASAIAVNNCIRSIAAAIMSFVAVPFEHAVGNGWVFTIMVGLNIIGIFCLIAVCYKGKYWREKIQSESTNLSAS
ncbi:6943_t:CDS:2 [Funneliformis caledonium]|uniref:6943_t:CDS:1 n=1 Tax=Funneliformis caledonium TaxID=1117310 RepID=A0A9N9HLK1_9GLOM|nr:6943_t:CDS:2 [Funneliformis caledonium]